MTTQQAIGDQQDSAVWISFSDFKGGKLVTTL